MSAASGVQQEVCAHVAPVPDRTGPVMAGPLQAAAGRMVGRTGELADLRERLAELRATGTGRLVLVSLEPRGRDVIERLFPAFNRGEALVSASLTAREKDQLASLLRKIIRTVEDGDATGG